MDGDIIKGVNLQDQPHVGRQAAFLTQLYATIAHSPRLIDRSKPDCSQSMWNVALQPYGRVLSPGSLSLPDRRSLHGCPPGSAWPA